MTDSTSSPQRILTGLQPSGELHIGNYFGALKPFVDFVHGHPDHEFVLMVADYHALTSSPGSQELHTAIYNIVRAYLAVGIDPERVVIFRQSDNPDHFELAWIFNCLVTVPFLMQAHSYKDKIAKGIEPSAGLFTYPMLMAADIALYDTNIVPVGEDQRQHIEYTREVVGKFNRRYGDTLLEPTEQITKSVGVIPGLDGHKMSKSYHNTIPLFASENETEQLVMKIVTDSSGDTPVNVYALHALFHDSAHLEELYQTHRGQYATLKKHLANDMNDFFRPFRQKYSAISDDDVKYILESGVIKARHISNQTMARVRQAIGISL